MVLGVATVGPQKQSGQPLEPKLYELLDAKSVKRYAISKWWSWSKAWRGDIRGLDGGGLKFFYDGQGFMSVQLTKKDAKIVFYIVFGNVLHRWRTMKQQLHQSIKTCTKGT